MKKIAAILAFLLLMSCEDTDRQSGSIHGIMGQRKETVYVCTGPMSQCYHIDRKCYGLQRCSKRVVTVSLQEAQENGRRPCHYCCKR